MEQQQETSQDRTKAREPTGALRVTSSMEFKVERLCEGDTMTMPLLHNKDKDTPEG